MSDQISYRPAGKSDCRSIAQLYSISSDGVADYVWTQIAEPGEEILDVGQRRYEREGTSFSYENCTVATVDGEVVGMLVAFPMFVEEDDAGEDDPVLAPYARLEEDASYYVCGVAVFPDYRGKGIGSEFMKLAEAQAGAQNLSKLSLIVFEQNSGAKRLYERLDYREVARETVVPHDLIHYTGNAILMVKDLA